MAATMAPQIKAHAAPPGAAPRETSDASLRLAAEHFTASTFFLLAGSVGLIWIAPLLAAGLYPERQVAAMTHLFTLGWVTTTILGALYQLLPVALGAPVRSERAGHVSFFAFAPGVVLFVAGIATGNTVLHHAGIALIATGVIVAIANFASTLPRATARDLTWWGIAIALVFLFSTLVLGIVLLHNLHTGFLADARLRVLGTHLHVAMGGFVLVMMVGVAQRLLPMFLLAHGVSERFARAALVLLPLGVTTLATGLTLDVSPVVRAGGGLLGAGVLAFAWHARTLFHKRVRRQLDPGMRFVAVALGFLVVAVTLGMVLLARGAVGHPRLATAYVMTALLGGIVLFVIGHAYKIIPLLAWTVHYRGRMGKESVPTVAETWSPKLALVQLGLMTAAACILIAGTLAGHAHCVRVGAVLWTAGTLLFAAQLARVTLGIRP